MRKTLMAMVAAALVIGGAIGATAQTGDPAPAAESSESGEVVRPLRAHMVAEVLDEMVADGVIDAEQATAIAEWLEARRSDLLERRAERRAAHEAAWADGVLTAQEAAGLPGAEKLLADDGPFAEAWEDGRLTRSEFEAIRSEFAPGRGFRHHRPGAAFPGRGDPSDA